MKREIVGKEMPLTKCTIETSFPQLEEAGFEEHRLGEAYCL